MLEEDRFTYIKGNKKYVIMSSDLEKLCMIFENLNVNILESSDLYKDAIEKKVIFPNTLVIKNKHLYIKTVFQNMEIKFSIKIPDAIFFTPIPDQFIIDNLIINNTTTWFEFLDEFKKILNSHILSVSAALCKYGYVLPIIKNNLQNYINNASFFIIKNNNINLLLFKKLKMEFPFYPRYMYNLYNADFANYEIIKKYKKVVIEIVQKDVVFSILAEYDSNAQWYILKKILNISLNPYPEFFNNDKKDFETFKNKILSNKRQFINKENFSHLF